ncbi:MAG: hypothetical protein U5Q44_06180 [Dehalococcoidia bacterium]|nr:hypothetical protein [Dehalococcoidia bacterium]
MAEQYVASDKRTGMEVTVQGEFPPHHDDRIRIARTTTLFTRLMSTILSTENEADRRQGFMAVETQLELAEALIRGDAEEVQRLLRDTMEKMGVTQEQFEDLAKRIVDQFGDPGQFGMPGQPPTGEPGPRWPQPGDDAPSDAINDPGNESIDEPGQQDDQNDEGDAPAPRG